jgi:hypothetical protein
MSRCCFFVPAVCLVLVGCGRPAASVSGTVTFDGKPLPGGTVLFHRSDGRVEHALISTEGKYSMEDAPLGKVRITVRAHGAVPPALPNSAVNPPTPPRELDPRPEDRRDSGYVPIPPRYLDPEKSGLTYTVSAGGQTHDIKLQP